MLTQHGFSLDWTPSTLNGKVQVTCRVTHQGGHFEECTLEAPPDLSGSKSAVQGIASTITLLERYSACAKLGIATRDMQESVVDVTDASARPVTGGTVDSGRNLRAAGALRKHGRTTAEAEQFLGRPVAEWTDGDIAKLKSWVEAPKFDDDDRPPPPSGEEREPGADG